MEKQNHIKRGLRKLDWTEKYRPQILDDVVGQDEIIDSLKEKTELKNHLLFSGPPGSGKTTMAYILAKRFNLPIVELNASDERGIEVVRGKIKDFSRFKGKRIILLDEADALTPPAQNALRRTIEKTKNAIFILTGNNGWNIIPALKSRCTDYDFKRIDDMVILERILKICKSENINIDAEAQQGLVTLMEQVKGDMRKAINTLSKVIDKEKKVTAKAVLSFIKPKLATKALQTALSGEFEKAQRILEDAYISSRLNIGDIIREFYDSIKDVKDVGIRARLYSRLDETARACRVESDPIMPLVNLVGFLSYAWIIPHLNANCPIMGETQANQ